MIKAKVYSIRVEVSVNFKIRELTKTLKQAGIIANYNNHSHCYTEAGDVYEVTITVTSEEQRILTMLLLSGRNDCIIDDRYNRYRKG